MHRSVVRDDPGEMLLVLLVLVLRIFLPLHLCPLLQVHDILYLLLCNVPNRLAFNIWCWRRLLYWILMHKRLSGWLSLMHRADRWSLARRASWLRSKVFRDERRCDLWLLLRIIAVCRRLHPWWIARLWVACLWQHGLSGCTS